MKILFISAVLPYPLHSGGQVRLYNLLKLLSKEHEITLYSFIRNESEKDLVSNLSFIKTIKLYLRGRVWQTKYIFRSMTSSLPLLLSSYENSEMKEDIKADLKKNQYDLIHCEPFYVCPSIPDDVQVPLVVTEHNIEYEVYQSYVKQLLIPVVRPLLNLDVQKIKNHEEMVWKKADRIISVATRDALVIGNVVDRKKISVVPNGVDTTYFSYEKKSLNKEHLKFLFVGNFFWVPNVKAVERLVGELWPKILKEIPQAQLTIVGKHLPQSLQDAAKTIHILYKEYVEDIRDAYKSSDILLAPMTISGGTKFKMIEAMASGCLVITTKEGMEGIDGKKDTHFIEAEKDEDYLSAIQKAVSNQKISQTMTARARALIVLEYDWKSIAEKQSDVWRGSV
jgi:glycosyltransferase involved in cell wall biosynthesis